MRIISKLNEELWNHEEKMLGNLELRKTFTKSKYVSRKKTKD